MVINITTTKWNTSIKSTDGINDYGIVIPYSEHNVTSPLVQVFKQKAANQFQLIMDPAELIIGVTDNDVVLIAKQPFDGKVVIK